MRAKLAPLRSQHLFPTVRLALLRAARREPEAFRLLHFSIQYDHLHLLVEARDNRALSRGMQSIAIRVARYANELLMRRGKFWADRWHGRSLRTPREVRSALVYVLANFRKHARKPRAPGIDPFSSGAWFDGWREWARGFCRAPPWAEFAGFLARTTVLAGSPGVTTGDPGECVVGPPHTWLARVGWRRHGLIGFDEAPSK